LKIDNLFIALPIAALILIAIAIWPGELGFDPDCERSEEFAGIVDTFEVSSGGWGTSDKAVVVLEDGRSVMVVGYYRMDGIETGAKVYKVTSCGSFEMILPSETQYYEVRP